MIKIKHFARSPEHICESDAQTRTVVGHLYLDQDGDYFLCVQGGGRHTMLCLKPRHYPSIKEPPRYPIMLAPDDIAIEITQGD